MKIGSLFSGYGGLDAGVQAVFGGEVAWHVEFDDAPSKILEHHFPGVPNFGDIRNVDWSSVEPVDILTGGFPCQDLSLAGRRAGMRPGTRSGLWSDFAGAIATLRPSMVVIENVRGLLSGCAESNLESCPGCVGDTKQHRPAVRALGRVLGDLSDLGYDAQWVGLRASDAGAPHGRFRVFIVAHPEGEPGGFGDRDDVRARGNPERFEPAAGGGVVGHTDDTGLEGRRLSGERAREQSVGTHGVVAVADAPDVGHERSRASRSRRSGDPDRRDASTNTRSERFWKHPGAAPAEEARQASGDVASGDGRSRPGQEWGPYLAAIRRWEQTSGRVAPSATDAGRLSPPFVEWMMGLPNGWVTDPGIGLTRTQQLKALGNGVVPQQAELALRMLTRQEVANGVAVV